MTPGTKRKIQEIQQKVINTIRKQPEFKSADQVLETAIEHFYQHLKRTKVL